MIHLKSILVSIVSTEDVSCKEIRLLSPKLAKVFVVRFLYVQTLALWFVDPNVLIELQSCS